MLAVEYSNQRSQQRFDVFTAVVAELDEEMKQSQHLHVYKSSAACRAIGVASYAWQSLK